jgi:hypothetical protein
MTQTLRDLNTELTDTGAEGLDRYMGMIVGFTDGIVDSTDKAKKWADNLIAPVGVYSELDNLLANGKITLDQYNAAQQAQIDITNDDARAQAARNQIQAEQAPLIAQQSDAAADYIEKLAGMTAGEQELALAYADPAQSKRITDIADMAAGYHDMTDAQKEAFGETVTSAAAADSSLAACSKVSALSKPAQPIRPAGRSIWIPSTPRRQWTRWSAPCRSGEHPRAGLQPQHHHIVRYLWLLVRLSGIARFQDDRCLYPQRRQLRANAGRSAPLAGRSTSPPGAWSTWPN